MPNRVNIIRFKLKKTIILKLKKDSYLYKKQKYFQVLKHNIGSAQNTVNDLFHDHPKKINH